jgi:5-methylcytosine-specific restriction endonuclease McrA
VDVGHIRRLAACRVWYDRHAEEECARKRAYNAAHQVQHADYLARTAEHRLETSRLYEETHREQRAERRRARRIEKGVEIRAAERQKYAARHDMELARQRRYREAHPERVTEAQRRYYETHHDIIVERQRAWEAAHRAESVARNNARRARIVDAPGHHTSSDIHAQSERQKHRCYWCGAKVYEHYHVDHVMPLALGGSDSPENLVIACPPCNLSKGARHPMEFAGVLC